MASVLLPSSHTAVRQTLTVYGANEEDAYDKVTLAAITSLSSSGAAGMSVLRYLPTDGYDDEWLRRHNMLEERIDTRPYAATMQFAHSDRIEELEAELAEAQQRLAQYEPDPSVAPVVEDEGSMMVNTRTGQSSGQSAQGAPPPPELATLVVQQAELIRLLAEDRPVRGQQQPREYKATWHYLSGFEGLRPPVFTNCPEPLAADDWLRTVQSKFTLLPGINEREEKARFAAQLLHGPAGAWYATFLAMQEEGHEPTWEEFRQAFRAHYIPASLMEQKRREFRDLKQGNRTVMQYVQTFIHLSQYAPRDVATEPERAERLLEGLDPTLRTHLARRYQSFTELVDTALDMENRLRAANEDQKRKG
ncbi:hypothetical protein BS78_K255900 [Paspalum vaginatum]|uniref:Retrotransposon gag domain-containing protein n=1 Tax=Paspalum vaginatum TaxID=158149 RepID=A0A9W7X6S1_9POAL|nr:hypothetical protein BS78_K255900 [Paspalum vaginatum]